MGDSRIVFIPTSPARILLALIVAAIFVIALLAAGGSASAQVEDVQFKWAHAMGSTAQDFPVGKMAFDSAGNMYATGAFQGTSDFDAGPGVTTLTSAGGEDIFVVKLGHSLW